MNKKTIRIPAMLFLSGISSTSFAAGFALIEQSVTGLGRAFAGSAAVSEDASAQYFNPAALSYLKREEMDLAINFIAPRSEFNNDGSTIPSNGGDYSDAANNAFLPNFSYVKPLNEKLTLGFAVVSPFGLVTEYNESWVGRYSAVKSDLKTYNFNPSLAFKATDKLSIGFGVSAQYIDLTLTQMARLAGSDVKVKLEADDWAYGYNMGVIYDFTPSTRVGLSYRSKISHTLEGDGSIRQVGVEDNITGDVDLPETLSLALQQRLSQKWTVMADVTWTRWSRFQELKIESDGGTLSSTKEEKWENTLRYGIGLSYAHSDKWQFRTGIAYDETPVPSAQYRTARIPDTDRTWLAVGATYHYSDNLILDAGYAHLFADNPKINETTGSSRLSGDYDVNVDIVGVQLRWLH
ncbi:hypothetical protein LCGC14_1472610 [marine sediment metagenome]|uniref:Long-chain fatty acid transport protein n=1 Tax=marine sediment metagenome TaxID=412755 RepID=A0A0F9JXX6_9ZZZZ